MFNNKLFASIGIILVLSSCTNELCFMLTPRIRSIATVLFKLAGLVIATFVFILLMAQVWYDMSYDKPLSARGRVYVFERPTEHPDQPRPYEFWFTRPQIAALRGSSPDVEAVGTMDVDGILQDPRTGELLRETPAAMVDEDFVKVFPFDPLLGSVDGFGRPDAAIVCESAARHLFGSVEEAFGSTLNFYTTEDPTVCEIIAVCRDFPANCRLSNIGVYVPLGSLWEDKNDPNYEAFEAFVLLRKGASADAVLPLMAEAFEKNWVFWESNDTPPDIRERVRQRSRLVPLHDMHYDPADNGTGSRTRDGVLSAIAILFLACALLNLFNLSMAGLSFSVQGNCVRRIFGAERGRLLLKQVLSSLVLCLLAFGVALLLVKLLAGSSLASMLSVPLNAQTLAPVWAVCLAVLAVGAVLAVLFPAFYGASFQPSAVLKGRINLSGRGKNWRVGTLLFQFLLSYIFIATGWMIGVQNRYVSDFDLGFKTKDIDFAFTGIFSGRDPEVVRTVLLQDPDITDVTFANYVLLQDRVFYETRVVNGTTVRFAGLDVTPDFLDFFGLQIVQGRGFTEADGQRATGSYIVNEAFLRAYPAIHIGDPMEGMMTGSHGTEAQIIGVVRDFHFEDLHHPITPFAFYCSGEPSNPGAARYPRVAVQTVAGKAGEVAGRLPGILNELSAQQRQEGGARCTVMEETIARFYAGNDRESRLVRVSSTLSLLLALLGILGLIYLEVQTIRKSVAIRKLHGATLPDLLRLLSGKYLILSTVAFAISVPVSIWVIRWWLQQFAEQAAVPVWIFALAWLMVTGLTLLVVAVMAVYISRTNPATELRRE